MSIDFQVDSNNNFDLTSDNLVYVEDLNKILQEGTRVLKIVQGELAYSSTLGLAIIDDYFRSVDYNTTTIKANLLTLIKQVSGVNSATVSSVSISSNTLTYTILISTDYGDGYIYG